MNGGMDTEVWLRSTYYYLPLLRNFNLKDTYTDNYKKQSIDYRWRSGAPPSLAGQYLVTKDPDTLIEQSLL